MNDQRFDLTPREDGALRNAEGGTASGLDAKVLAAAIRRALHTSYTPAPLKLPPAEPQPDAPIDITALPDYWDERRRKQQKPDKSRCAAELRIALEEGTGKAAATVDSCEVCGDLLVPEPPRCERHAHTEPGDDEWEEHAEHADAQLAARQQPGPSRLRGEPMNHRAQELCEILSQANLNSEQQGVLQELWGMAIRAETNNQRWSRFFEIAIGALADSDYEDGPNPAQRIVQEAASIATAAVDHEKKALR